MPAALPHANHPRQPVKIGWLLRLRWSAIAAQLATIIGAQVLVGAVLPMGPLLAVIAAEVALTLLGYALARRGAAVDSLAIGLLLADAFALTGLLLFSGGPENPFNFLYIVYIALGAVALPGRWPWVLAALSIALGGLLFVDSMPLVFDADAGWLQLGAADPHAGHAGHAGHAAPAGNGGHGGHGGHGGGSPIAMAIHLWGMWVGLAVASVFVVFFIQRIRRSLLEREAELADAQMSAQRSERLASLATLAAGAAHELATPLSTIAITARELERDLELADADPESIGDAKLIREQVRRCRTVLEQMSVELGVAVGSARAPITLAELCRDATAHLDPARMARVAIDDRSTQWVGQTHGAALARALRALIDNALDACTGAVTVTLSRDDTFGQIAVRDEGLGVPAAIAARLGEPFFTTKAPGMGMGMGLFLSRTIIERLGGTLEMELPEDAGATMTLRVPATLPEGTAS